MDDVVNEEIVEKNLEVIRTVLSEGNVDIWAAWGKLIKKRVFLKECLESIMEIADTYHCKWYTIGETTKDGHPRHPLYLNGGCEMVKFDISKYLQKI